MRFDLDLERLFEDDKAVSPVIGVILMVAITVILAAVIGTFVLDLGQNVQTNPQAGVSFDVDNSAFEVTVTVNSVQRADSITVDCGTIGGGGSLSASAGSTLTCGPGGSGDSGTVTVTGTYNDNTVVLQQRDYEF